MRRKRKGAPYEAPRSFATQVPVNSVFVLCLDAGAEVAPRLACTSADFGCVLGRAALLRRVHLGALLHAGLRAGDLRHALTERVRPCSCSLRILPRTRQRRATSAPLCTSSLRSWCWHPPSRSGPPHARPVACVELSGAFNQISVPFAVIRPGSGREPPQTPLSGRAGRLRAP